MWHCFQAHMPHLSPSNRYEQSTLQYKHNYYIYIYMLPISFYHEDGLFLQLPTNILPKYI